MGRMLVDELPALIISCSISFHIFVYFCMYLSPLFLEIARNQSKRIYFLLFDVSEDPVSFCLHVAFPPPFTRLQEFLKITRLNSHSYYVISASQELKATIQNREPAIEKIRLGYTRLSPDGASVAAREVEPLMLRWSSLVAVLTDHLESRAGLLVKFRGYHEEHSQVDRGVEELLGDIQQIESDDDIPLRDRIIQLEVGAFVFLFFFVLRRCSTAGFALRHPMALSFFRS